MAIPQIWTRAESGSLETWLLRCRVFHCTQAFLWNASPCVHDFAVLTLQDSFPWVVPANALPLGTKAKATSCTKTSGDA